MVYKNQDLSRKSFHSLSTWGFSALLYFAHWQTWHFQQVITFLHSYHKFYLKNNSKFLSNLYVLRPSDSKLKLGKLQYVKTWKQSISKSLFRPLISHHYQNNSRKLQNPVSLLSDFSAYFNFFIDEYLKFFVLLWPLSKCETFFSHYVIGKFYTILVISTSFMAADILNFNFMG